MIGGTGNDWLEGGYGGDTYVFNRGDGKDTVFDVQGEQDIVLFGAGILSDDIIVTQGANQRDIILTIRGTTDSITLQDQISYNNIETIRFCGWNGMDGTSPAGEILCFDARQRSVDRGNG